MIAVDTRVSIRLLINAMCSHYIQEPSSENPALSCLLWRYSGAVTLSRVRGRPRRAGRQSSTFLPHHLSIAAQPRGNCNNSGPCAVTIFRVDRLPISCFGSCMSSRTFVWGFSSISVLGHPCRRLSVSDIPAATSCRKNTCSVKCLTGDTFLPNCLDWLFRGSLPSVCFAAASAALQSVFAPSRRPGDLYRHSVTAGVTYYRFAVTCYVRPISPQTCRPEQALFYRYFWTKVKQSSFISATARASEFVLWLWGLFSHLPGLHVKVPCFRS